MTAVKRAQFDRAAGVWRCTWPGCAYSHEEAGAVRLHHYRKHEVGQRGEETAPAEAAGGDCQHVWRALNERSELEARAIRAGYVEVCRECQNVR